MGNNVIKPVFGVSDRVRCKQACYYNFEILVVASLDMILSNKRSDCVDAQAGLRICCLQIPEYYNYTIKILNWTNGKKTGFV